MGTLWCRLLNALLLLPALLLPVRSMSSLTRPLSTEESRTSCTVGPAADGSAPEAHGAGPAALAAAPALGPVPDLAGSGEAGATAEATEPSASDAVAAGVTNAELSLVSSMTIPVSEEAPAASSAETAGAALGGESPKLKESALDIPYEPAKNKPPS